MLPPPVGTITFLFSDIEGSTKLWEAHPEAMRLAVARHDAILRQAVADNGGYLFKTTGDGIAAAFALAPDALAAALSAQQALLVEPWPSDAVLRSRMGLHTGAAELRDSDYFGATLSRAARLMAAGHGGQTLLSDVTHELTRDSLPEGVSLLPLGEHRLKDLARPETIYQMAHAALPAADSFPPLRTLDVTPNNLPQQVTSFVGREKPLADVAALLGKTRLLTLTGSGGSGKTRLSLQAAADALEQYPDGAWLVELAALDAPALVSQTVAAALGVREQAGEPVTQTLTGFLKPRRLLLMLDNCEHVLAACATLVAALIRACPDVKVIATSREPLGIAGETTYRVPTLTLPSASQAKAATAESLSQYEAVRLFIERAQAVKPDFAATNANAPALAQLCFYLDGIPLALELAAARVRSLSVEQINDKLDSRFRLLTGGDRAALPRQQTLRALIDWSYDLLSENEKTLLARLSIFAGGWTLDAAEAVCGTDPIEEWEVLDLLTSLADKSLVLAEEQGDEKASVRYRMLETVRQYAQEKLAAGEQADDVAARHREFFVALAEEAEPQLKSSEQSLWLNRLEIEHDNLRAVLDDCAAGTVTHGRDASREALFGLRLSAALVQFWETRGYLGEGRGHIARALAARPLTKSAGAEAEKATAAALRAGGRLAWLQSDYPATEAFYTESLSLYRKINDKRGIARTLAGLGNNFSYQGDYSTAQPLFDESLNLYREVDDKNGIAGTLGNLAVLAAGQSDYSTARTLFEESLRIYRETGDRGNIAFALHNQGVLARDRSDFSAARKLFEESLSLYRQVGEKRGTAATLADLGYIAAYVQEDYRAAQALFEESLSRSRDIGNKRGIVYATFELGFFAYKQGNYSAAQLFWEENLSMCREVHDKRSVANTLVYLGSAAFKQGDNLTAQTLYNESLSLSREIGDKRGAAFGLDAVAIACANHRAIRQAVTLWAAAKALRASIGTLLPPFEQAELDTAMAQAQVALADNAAWDAAWDEGMAMPWEKAVALALGEVA